MIQREEKQGNGEEEMKEQKQEEKDPEKGKKGTVARVVSKNN